MTSTARQITRPPPRGPRRLLWSIAALWLPAEALAQSGACDQLKATLAARIEATGVRGYSLEAVPAATPVPAGAKAIGNCESGARKILYRRWGGASAAASAAVTAAPASAAPAARVPERPVEPPPKPPAPLVRPAVKAPSVPIVTPAPAPAPTMAAEPAKVPVVRAAEVEVLPQPAPVVALEEQPPLRQRVSGFVSANWRWLLALLLVPLAVVGWFWRAHDLAYDKNGLPRGPRL